MPSTQHSLKKWSFPFCHNIIFSCSVLLVTPLPDSLFSSLRMFPSFSYSCLYVLAFYPDLKQHHFMGHHQLRFFLNTHPLALFQKETLYRSASSVHLLYIKNLPGTSQILWSCLIFIITLQKYVLGNLELSEII